jgi:hypothetical protein
MTPFRFIALSSLLVLGAVGAWNCAHAPQAVQLSHMLLSAPDHVTVRVVCDGVQAYTLTVEPGEPVEIAGPEALCKFIPDRAVEISLEPVWEQE